MANLIELKRVKHAVLYQDPTSKLKVIMLENCRASFPFVGSPGEDEDEQGNKKKSWRLTFMLPKTTHTDAKNMIKELILELQKSNDVTVPSMNWFLADGDGEKYKADDKYKEMWGHWLVNGKDSSRRPTVRNERAIVMDDIDEIDNKFYGGCWVNGMIRPWYFNGKTKKSPKTYPKRILAGLNSVQFVRDDKPFGQGRIDDTDVYSAVEGSGNGMDEDDDGL